MMKTKILYLLLFTTVISNVVIAQRGKKNREEKENGKGIAARFALELNMTKDPVLGYVPKGRLVEAYNQRKFRLENNANRATLFNWIERGPNSDVVGASNGNTRPGNGITSGRIRTLWEDQSDATGKTVWIGGVDGGLWKTNDITATPATWTPINDYLGNLSVASICQDPTNFNIMYFGTGEKADNADAVRGAGVWISTDHGVNWTVMNGTSNFWKISKVLCDASGNLYVACSSGSGNPGLQRYTKSTGTWANITPTGLSTRIEDIELSSTGRFHVACGYRSSAASSGYRYTDFPATVIASTWISPVTSYTPAEINVDLASNGNTLYALPSNSSYQVATIYKSTDGGANWAATGSTPTFTSGQGWYCMGVAIDPNNANNVIVGSLDCYKSTNGGTSWTKISEWVGTTGQYVHADQQIITWRSNNQVLVGCDGGIHYSPNGGTNFYDKNTGLRIKQFYSVAIHPSSTNYFLAGAQDNGNHQLNSPGLGSSVEVTGGDGAFVHIDQNQPAYQWGAYVYNRYRRSTNGGSSWSSIDFSSSGRFINPTDYDDANNIMYCSYTANTYLRWNDPQTGSTFASVSMELNGGSVSAIKVSPYNSNTVFFGGGGGTSPALTKATNANSIPTITSIISSSMQSGGGNINCIELGTNDNNIIVAFSNYGINNLWVTNDGGANWSAVDGNLPDMPVRWAMFYPGDNTKAIIATETGVWQTELINGSLTAWDPETGFPNVRTDMLQYRSSDGLLAAATHGRGIFTTSINTTPSCGAVTGLTSSAITTTSETISWSALSGANTYDVNYKLATEPSIWTNAVTATTATSLNLSGLTESTVYDWQVRANCTGATGAYSNAQFTTASPAICGSVTGLTSSLITSSSAKVSWSALGNANNYNVDYKLATEPNTWTNAATATASIFVNLSGLTASTLYDWRVRANCTGSSGSYVNAQFITGAVGCPDILEPNNTSITAAPVSAGISYNALIAANGDNDYYSFNNSSTLRKIRVTLTNLPANYDLKLYKPNGNLQATSQNTGTTNETVIYNPNNNGNSNVGTYTVYVYGSGGVFNATQCYTLLVELNATNFGPANTPDEGNAEIVKQEGLKLYPVPASKSVMASFDANSKGKAEITIIDQVGRVVLRKIVSVDQGINFNNLDIGKLSSGIYTVKISQEKEIKVKKLVILQ